MKPKHGIRIGPIVLLLSLLLSISCTQVSAEKIAFYSTRDDPEHNHPSLYVMDTDGANQVKIAPVRSLPNFCWSPNGAKIVFADEKWVCLVDADGANLTKLAEMPGVPEVISLSPDGRKIAVSCFEGYKDVGETYPQLLHDIYTVDVKTGELKNLTNSPAIEEGAPSWSPDGKRLAFGVGYRDLSTNEIASFDICQMDADGTNKVTLISESGEPMGTLAWQPDGDNILYDFAAPEESYFGDICLVNTKGGSKVNLTNSPDIKDYHPSWSPDGKKIVFVSSQRTADPLKPDQQIYVMDADGSHLTRLTDSGGGKWWPSWSPDGKKIAFTVVHCRDADTDDIYVMDAYGSDMINLTGNTLGDDFYCVWSPQ